ncbi:MAG: phage shock protein operon transcriptional activator [Candidatus Abyssobacteria bacterium SURF_5]|uniref:Phage shock protein operon transcriptional activator n=1 Tax=Abyssobacteria bacterium (strain SURF_5) TaxID=2093360 RepID=A0A3A4NXV6_ABYX5|nr:MAG: phage shock protein operon transcriptional activator [Candidatus Abyssubacteria bacterium SURF_5]
MGVRRDEARRAGIGEALGQSEVFLDFQERLSRVARVDRPVLLIGERGTGKELAASKLHYLSARWQGPLVALNCAALAPTLIESELFGHEAGAFTSARGRRKGRFEAAHGGTLFLDEVGSIPIEVQEKILRAVEYRSFEQVGSSEQVHVDVRIIGATNADLPALVESGEFKRDLLDRLSFEVLFLPPLRERKGDIALLARHFASRMSFEMGRDGVVEFSDGAIGALERYHWPGNVRELKNVVERAVYRADSLLIDRIEFDPFRDPYERNWVQNQVASEDRHEAQKKSDGVRRPLMQAVEELEMNLISKALEESRYNQKKAAFLLGLTYDQFRGLYRKYKKRL